MEPVCCCICKKVVSPLDCWCVIDTKTHSRQYECKKSCKLPTPPRPVPNPPPPPLEPFELEIVDEPEIETEQEPVSVGDWANAYPRNSLLQRIRQWFTTPPGYTKVKIS